MATQPGMLSPRQVLQRLTRLQGPEQEQQVNFAPLGTTEDPVRIEELIAGDVDVVQDPRDASAIAEVTLENGVADRDGGGLREIEPIAAGLVAGNSGDGDVAGVLDAEAVAKLTAVALASRARLGHLEHRGGGPCAGDGDVVRVDV